jgi:PKD repeat protein
VDAGPDGTIGRDETFTIDLEVMNHSTVPVEDVRIEADLNDAFVTLTPHSSTLSGLQPGETRLVSAAMTMHTGEDIPDEHEFRCNLSLITSSDTLLKDIGLKAVASRLRFGGITVVDGNNQWLDPGENAILELKLNNLGHDRATGVSVRIICTDPYLSVNQSTLLDYAEIPPQNSGSGSLNVTANPVSPEGHLVPVTIEINQDLGAPVTETFILQIGRTPILVIDLDENLSSGPVIQQSINGLGIAADLVTPIPWWELHKYRAIFLCLGVFPFNHELTAEEGDHFATYLLEGGNLYMEGSTTWFLDDHTPLHDLLHIQGKNQGWISGIDTLVGEAAAWTSDLSFAYTGEHTRMDNLIPVEPAYPLFSEKTSGYDYTVAFDAVNYRSIGASYEFAGLDGLGSASALMLMDRYLQFFGMESSGLAANFLADTVSILTHQQVQFTDLSTSTAVMWQWSFPGGSPSSSTEIDPVVVYDSAGVFDVSLTVTDGTGANTLVKRNYITVVSGTGIADLHSEEVLRIYPNPTAGLFWLESPLNSGEVQVTILNQTGRRVIERLLKVPGNGIVTLDVHWLPSGVYLVRLTDDKACHTEKLIILH